jgi:type II restriction/modification system DNA methylase subunit YeeA
MTPLRQEWTTVRAEVETALQRATRLARELADRKLHDFVSRLGRVTVLDPACGSGNFLYIALQKLKDLEKEVIDFALSQDFSAYLPEVGPWQLYGIEVNPYAHELAQMTVWIGYLQWLREHGYLITDDPILRSTDNIRCMDAVIDLATGTEPEWPAVEFIVGNPPFLGDKVMRRGLGDDYVEALRRLYAGRIPGQSDLCCYWFERARQQIVDGRCRRAGLLATQGIRGGANRETLNRIKETGDIFFAVSDREWILDGANVHVSLIGFDSGIERYRMCDGQPVQEIRSNLSGGEDHHSDVTKAQTLPANAGVCFLGVMKAGDFDITDVAARAMLSMPNVHGRPNSDVLRLRVTARDILHKSGKGWIIDFGADGAESTAACYEMPWEHVVKFVKPEREGNRRQRMADRWWLHGEARPGMRNALAGLSRFIVTPEVSKHRIFIWLDAVYLADHQTRAFARADDYSFGVLHSRVHEAWARAQGTQLRERESGFRYTPSSCFETFPLPEPTDTQRDAITAAALDLDTLRNRWLNPPEWMRTEVLEFPGAVDGPWVRYVHEPNSEGIGMVRYPRLVPKDEESAHQLVARTLTNLYNQRPAWLDMAHKRLDADVCAAYGFDLAITDEQIMARLMALNLERSAQR